MIGEQRNASARKVFDLARNALDTGNSGILCRNKGRTDHLSQCGENRSVFGKELINRGAKVIVLCLYIFQLSGILGILFGIRARNKILPVVGEDLLCSFQIFDLALGLVNVVLEILVCLGGMLYPGGIHLILFRHQLVQFGFCFLDFLRSPRIIIRWNLRIRKFLQLIRKIVNSLLHGIRQLIKAFQRRSCYAHSLIRRGFQFGKVRCQRIKVFLEIGHGLLGSSRIKCPGKIIVLRTVHLIFHVFQCSVQAVHLRL